MPRIFVTQMCVDQWIAAGKVKLEGDLVRLDGLGMAMSLFINPAVHFEAADGGAPDSGELVGTVKSSQELRQIDAEHYDTSVIVGDAAYTVRPGFVGVPVGADGTETLLDAATWHRLVSVLRGV